MIRTLLAIAAAIALTTVHSTPLHAAQLARITYYTESGTMYSGLQTFPGAAACSWDLPLYTRITIAGDTYTCLDRGLLGSGYPYTWIDIFDPSGSVPTRYGDWQQIEVLLP